jgi:hypothetical protein
MERTSERQVCEENNHLSFPILHEVLSTISDNGLTGILK